MPTAREAAQHYALGMMAHDHRDYDEAVDSFVVTDSFQFTHLDDEEVRDASRAYVDALWAKDDVEDWCRGEDGDIDPGALRDADWSGVRGHLLDRAKIIGADREYAWAITDAWVEHKAGGDYWTPYLKAQLYECRAAMQNDDYPATERDDGGDSTHGFGVNPFRYLLGVELHDSREYEQGLDMMESYYLRIAEHHT